jgi:hypothetical protein
MSETIQKLFETIAKDAELAEKFEGCASAEESYQIATSIAGGYTLEEYIAAASEAAKRKMGELSDDDLEGAIGGNLTPSIIRINDKILNLWAGPGNLRGANTLPIQPMPVSPGTGPVTIQPIPAVSGKITVTPMPAKGTAAPLTLTLL